MSRLTAALAALLSGCGAPAIQVHLIDDTPEYREIVREGAAMWELEVDFVGSSELAVEVEIWERTHEELSEGTDLGHATDQYGCVRGFWAHPHPFVVAHELGHVFWLEHRGEGNIMHPNADWSWEPTEKQLRRVQRRAARYATVCGNDTSN